jgi:hypothetical protein
MGLHVRAVRLCVWAMPHLLVWTMATTPAAAFAGATTDQLAHRGDAFPVLFRPQV